MLIALFAAATIASASLSAEARSAIAPVLDAIAAERSAQAKLPPPKDDPERLVRLGRLDQSPRKVLQQVDLSKAPASDRERARATMNSAISDLDRETEAEVLRLMPPEGWFAKSRYGEEAARAAFLIIQHSSVENWRRFLPVIERFVGLGEASGESYALMYDRLAVNEGRAQRFGSQLRCQAGKLVPYPLEDASRVEALRKEMGMAMTYAQQLEFVSRSPFPC